MQACKFCSSSEKIVKNGTAKNGIQIYRCKSCGHKFTENGNYNFCRTHQSIQKTPAEASGLQVKGWKQLIENAQAYRTSKESESKQEIPVEVQISK